MMSNITNSLSYRCPLVLAVVLIALNGCQSQQPSQQNQFVTWQGIGPDKWASTWLISRQIDPKTQVQFIEVGTQPTSGIAFDIPTIPPYIRTGTQTTYETLIGGYQLTDATTIEVGQIIRDIEIDSWGSSQSNISLYVEDAFRGLQFVYGREHVPANCYFELFDKLYRYLQNGADKENGPAIEQTLNQDRSCASAKQTPKIDDHKFVAEWRPEQVLNFIGAGDKVVFIDTRETDEFEEGHIPGALNIKLRDLDQPLPPEIKNADVVIPYCVKDFRGFEVAKKLKLQGIKRVGLMNPWGITGWKAVGLPVTGSKALNKKDAEIRLQKCADKPEGCIKDA